MSDPSRDDNPIVYANEQFEHITGYAEAEVRGRNCRFLQGEQTAREPVAEMRTAIDAGEPVTVELRNYRSDGTEFWNRVSIAPVRGDDGEITNWVGFQQDVTVKKERERRLRRKERRYQSIFNDPNILVGLIDTDGTVIDINQTAMEYVAATRAEIIGTPFPITPWFDHSAEIQRDVREWIERAAGGEYVEFEADLVGPSGDPYTVAGVIRPVTNDDGEVVSLLISDRDITERKERERKLQRYEAYLEGSTDIITVLDDDGTITYQSPAVERILGYKTDELIGQNGFDFIHPDDEAAVFEEFTDLIAEPKNTVTVECRFRTADEGWRWIEIRGTNYLDDDAVRGIVANSRDITDRREREQALTQLQQRTETLMQTTTVEETAQVAVDTAQDLLGAELSGCHLLGDDPDRLEPIAFLDAAREGSNEPPTYDRQADTDPPSKLVWDTFERGEHLVIEDTREYDGLAEVTPTRSAVIHPLGEHGVFIVSSTTTDAFDESEKTVIEILATALTAALDRVEREQELRRQIERLDKFASIISHDLRNPLNVATGHLELARQECASEHLDGVSNAHDRMEALIDDILALAREGKQESESEPVDLAAVSTGCWQTVATADATLVVETERTFQANPSRLQQLLENLFRNAIEHGGADVTVTVGEVADGFYVADDGPGVPEDEHDRVFDLGYSTAEGGTGFGLNIVREIADTFGWDIRVTSSAAGGARFEITGVGGSDA
ncbi:PAS domain S-box protein [Haloarcula halophila]|uniref:PAS domain-containing sensor histidine kinase n=1 Tax=Haloarcula halophila TaxID=3032584 RepID=UPI0023E40185|nr:PAS domain S-box protein [Halomicroarcula sp. DFY41]